MQGQQVQPVRLPHVPLPQTMDEMCPVHGRTVRRDLDDVLHASVGGEQGELAAALQVLGTALVVTAACGACETRSAGDASLERRGTAWRWR